jgi:hypothetical protein
MRYTFPLRQSCTSFAPTRCITFAHTYTCDLGTYNTCIAFAHTTHLCTYTCIIIAHATDSTMGSTIDAYIHGVQLTLQLALQLMHTYMDTHTHSRGADTEVPEQCDNADQFAKTADGGTDSVVEKIQQLLRSVCVCVCVSVCVKVSNCARAHTQNDVIEQQLMKSNPSLEYYNLNQYFSNKFPCELH